MGLNDELALAKLVSRGSDALENILALILGFSLSAFLQVFFRKEQITKQYGRAGLREVALATFFGAVSSSCSCAASAAAKIAFKKGGSAPRW